MSGRDEREALQEIARRAAGAVDAGRVMARLAALAQLGLSERGGVNCPGFSDTEAAANDLVAGWMREAGLTVARDAIGNLFGSTDGNAPGVAPLAAGSHIDTVPEGGKYDGRLGVVGAIEAVEAIRATGVTLSCPLEVIVWRCEEPSRFAAGRIGSQFFAGELAINDLLPQGAAFGLAERLADEARQGLPERAAGRGLAGYLELHIEQGKRLEEAGTEIGVVTAIAAATRIRIAIDGAADHSGATPMGLRRDALCAAAELILATERAGFARAEEQIVATAVRIAAEPGALNVVPGRVELWLDVRGIAAAPIAATIAQIRQDATAIAAVRNVTIAIEEHAAGTPIAFAPNTVDALDAAARAVGYTSMRLPSGAGHDAQTIAPLAPSGMIFVPSVAGISHSPAEFTPPEAIERGVRLLTAAWARQASAEG